MARRKTLSRPKRWASAVEAAQTILSQIEDLISQLAEPLQELSDLKDEYQDWLDNLPQSLQSSALGDKLQVITSLDFEEPSLDNLEQIRGYVEEAESADLPQGFGRD